MEDIIQAYKEHEIWLRQAREEGKSSCLGRVWAMIKMGIRYLLL